MELIISLGGLERRFNVDDEDIYNNDWGGTIQDMLDTLEKSKEL